MTAGNHVLLRSSLTYLIANLALRIIHICRIPFGMLSLSCRKSNENFYQGSIVTSLNAAKASWSNIGHNFAVVFSRSIPESKTDKVKESLEKDKNIENECPERVEIEPEENLEKKDEDNFIRRNEYFKGRWYTPEEVKHLRKQESKKGMIDLGLIVVDFFYFSHL